MDSSYRHEYYNGDYDNEFADEPDNGYDYGDDDEDSIFEYRDIEESREIQFYRLVDQERQKEVEQINIKKLLDGLSDSENYDKHRKKSCLAAWTSLLVMWRIENMELKAYRLNKHILKNINRQTKYTKVESDYVYTLQDITDVMEGVVEHYHSLSDLVCTNNEKALDPMSPPVIKTPVIDPEILGLEKSWEVFHKNTAWYNIYQFACHIVIHAAIYLKEIHTSFAKETDSELEIEQGDGGITILQTREILNEQGDPTRTKTKGGALDFLVLLANFMRLMLRDTLQLYTDLGVKKVHYVNIETEQLWKDENKSLDMISKCFMVMDKTESFRSEFFEVLCNKLEPEFFDCLFVYMNQHNFMNQEIKKANDLNTDMTIEMMRTLCPDYLAKKIGNQDDLLGMFSQIIKDTKSNRRSVRNMLTLLITKEWFGIRHIFKGWFESFTLTKFKNTNIIEKRFNDPTPKLVEYAPYQWGVITNSGDLYVHPRVEVLLCLWKNIIVKKHRGVIYSNSKVMNLSTEELWEMNGYMITSSSEQEMIEKRLSEPNQIREYTGRFDPDDFGDNYIKHQSEVIRYINIAKAKVNQTSRQPTPQESAFSLTSRTVAALQSREVIDRVRERMNKRRRVETPSSPVESVVSSVAGSDVSEQDSVMSEEREEEEREEEDYEEYDEDEDTEQYRQQQQQYSHRNSSDPADYDSEESDSSDRREKANENSGEKRGTKRYSS